MSVNNVSNCSNGKRKRIFIDLSTRFESTYNDNIRLIKLKMRLNYDIFAMIIKCTFRKVF